MFDAHDQCLSVGIFSVFIFCLLSFNLIVISAGKPGFWVKDLVPELFTAGAPRGRGRTHLFCPVKKIFGHL